MAAGALCGGIGLLVLAGWHLHLRALVQARSGMIPVQYNTAICLVLCDAALIAAEQARRRTSPPPRWCAGPQHSPSFRICCRISTASFRSLARRCA
jgi:hypothetical protein